ncbi:malate synthase A [Gracilimonas sp.]|uniref:malate synthase n=1 Tax=Gracilimonas sp. TaxID=1974203 RepID=UPI003456E085
MPWVIDSIPDDLKDRSVEILGPADRKSIVHALNSDANVFIADFEDATSPTWKNCIWSQINLRDTVKGNIWYMDKLGIKRGLNDNTAAIEVRPRGLHLNEKHMLIDGEPISASFFDFGLYVFHNALPLLRKGSGPYFSLPKLENRHEAEFWKDIFQYAEDKLPSIRPNVIKASVCVETLPAVFELDEIIYELREHLTGLEAGRWNYLFSLIKNFRKYKRYILPDRDLISIGLPFMEAYSQLIVKMAHRRNLHAIGDMTVAMYDKTKLQGLGQGQQMQQSLIDLLEGTFMEASQGFDGTQIIDSELVTLVREVFQKFMEGSFDQKDNLRDDISISRLDLLYTHLLDAGKITEKKFRQNIDVMILYIASWLRGRGVIELDKRLVNTSTVEIFRTQMWQWSHQPGIKLDDGRPVTKELFEEFLAQEKKQLIREYRELKGDSEIFERATELVSNFIWADDFEPYLSMSAYNLME